MVQLLGAGHLWSAICSNCNADEQHEVISNWYKNVQVSGSEELVNLTLNVIVSNIESMFEEWDDYDLLEFLKDLWTPNTQAWWISHADEVERIAGTKTDLIDSLLATIRILDVIHGRNSILQKELELCTNMLANWEESKKRRSEAAEEIEDEKKETYAVPTWVTDAGRIDEDLWLMELERIRTEQEEEQALDRLETMMKQLYDIADAARMAQLGRDLPQILMRFTLTERSAELWGIWLALQGCGGVVSLSHIKDEWALIVSILTGKAKSLDGLTKEMRPSERLSCWNEMLDAVIERYTSSLLNEIALWVMREAAKLKSTEGDESYLSLAKTHFIESIVKLRNWKPSTKILDNIPKFLRDVEAAYACDAYYSIASKVSQVLPRKKAVDLFASLESIVLKYEIGICRSSALAGLAQGFAILGDLNRAVRLLELAITASQDWSLEDDELVLRVASTRVFAEKVVDKVLVASLSLTKELRSAIITRLFDELNHRAKDDVPKKHEALLHLVRALSDAGDASKNLSCCYSVVNALPLLGEASELDVASVLTELNKTLEYVACPKRDELLARVIDWLITAPLEQRAEVARKIAEEETVSFSPEQWRELAEAVQSTYAIDTVLARFCKEVIEHAPESVLSVLLENPSFSLWNEVEQSAIERGMTPFARRLFFDGIRQFNDIEAFHMFVEISKRLKE